MPSVFLIGGTGHLGGAILQVLQAEHPDLPVKVLVRSADKASRLRAKYPKVETVLGDLSKRDVVTSNSREADIVLNAAPDITHEEDIKAALDSMHEPGRPRKGFYVQTTGSSNVYSEPTGAAEERIWDDLADIQEIMNFNPRKTHVAVDNILRDASDDVYVANMSPPGIGGISPSIEHPAPLTTGPYVMTARAFNSGFQINAGENIISWVHCLDLARAFLILINNALDSLTTNQPPAEPAGFPLWGREAYYYISSEDIAFKDKMAHLVGPLHRAGIIGSTRIASNSSKETARVCLAGSTDYDPDMKLPDADSWQLHIAISLGVNMRTRGSRLRKLGWAPREPSLLESDEDIVSCYLGWEKRQGAQN
ncbi:hypothetical protein F5Y15DRAFT_209403 [Xylariaceae sp. FL0016]|nr:hypothetical protein F5Y15DRAFT_209403 [Xylariaceae sp. FL0016]